MALSELGRDQEESALPLRKFTFGLSIEPMQPESFESRGFAIVPRVLTHDICEDVLARLVPAGTASGGTRCLLRQPWCASLARDLRQHAVLAALVPAASVAVQCTYFEKSVARNWLVPMHQDLSIPVLARVEERTLGGWSEKEHALFVQAPVDVLEQMIGVRIHLDACTMIDGPLDVVPGSHALGRLDSEAVALVCREVEKVKCVAGKGDALVMRPLLLHGSSKARGDDRRRILHFVFGPKDLPYGLRWRMDL